MSPPVPMHRPPARSRAGLADRLGTPTAHDAPRVDLRRTLFFQFHKVGDSLILTPLIEAVKRASPDNQVLVVGSPQAAEVLANNPYVDEMHTTRLIPYMSRPDLARAIPRFARLARRWGATTVICDAVNSNPLMAILLRFLPVRHRVMCGAVKYQDVLCSGYVHANADVRIDRAAAGTVLGYNLALLDHIGCPRGEGKVRVYPTDAERARAHAFVDRLGLDPARRTVGFAPYSKTASTAWTREHIAAFASAAAERYNLVVFGGRDEADRWRDDTGGLADTRNIYQAFGLNLRESSVAMNRADVMVTLNTGASHLFHTLQVPLVRLNASMQPPQLWGYDGEPGYFPLRHPVACSPCFLNDCAVPGHPCMAGITPAAVLRKIAEVVRA